MFGIIKHAIGPLAVTLAAASTPAFAASSPLGVWIDQLRLAGGGGFAAFDVRALNSFYFGLALYLTVLFRVRRRPQSAQSISERYYEWRRLRAVRAQSVE